MNSTLQKLLLLTKYVPSITNATDRGSLALKEYFRNGHYFAIEAFIFHFHRVTELTVYE